MRNFCARYPDLFAPTTWPWGPTDVQFELCSVMPPSKLIANVNLVPRLADNWLLVDVMGEGWDVPGGALEPGETMLEALRRELIEEAGASLESFSVLGAWHCISLAAAPYRPHQPHPEYYRVVGFGAVSLNGVPLNPEGAEQIRAVEAVSLEEAVRRLVARDRPDLADLYRLAAELASARNEIEL